MMIATVVLTLADGTIVFNSQMTAGPEEDKDRLINSVNIMIDLVEATDEIHADGNTNLLATVVAEIPGVFRRDIELFSPNVIAAMIESEMHIEQRR